MLWIRLCVNLSSILLLIKSSLSSSWCTMPTTNHVLLLNLLTSHIFYLVEPHAVHTPCYVTNQISSQTSSRIASHIAIHSTKREQVYIEEVFVVLVPWWMSSRMCWRARLCSGVRTEQVSVACSCSCVWGSMYMAGEHSLSVGPVAVHDMHTT